MCYKSVGNLSPSEVQLLCDRIEGVEVGLEPWAQEPSHSVVLPYGRHQRVPFQHPHMVLHQIILHSQVGGELVKVPGTLLDRPYYPGPVLAASGAAE